MAYCELSGSVVGYDGQTLQPGSVLTVFRALSSAGSIIASDIEEYRLLNSGSWAPPLRFERAAVVYVHLNAPGYDLDPNNGTPLQIPDASGATLASIAAAVNIPEQVAVAVPGTDHSVAGGGSEIQYRNGGIFGAVSGSSVSGTGVTLRGLALTPSSLSVDRGLTIAQTASGAPAADYSLNRITISSDNMDAGAGFGSGFSVTHVFGGSAAKGGRVGLYASLELNNTTNASNTNRNYVGVVALAFASATDGGGLGTELGAIFGTNPVGFLSGGATDFLEVTAGEANFGIGTGASAKHVIGWSIVTRPDHAVAASTTNASLGISAQGGALGLAHAILVGDLNGAHPLLSSGTILGTTGAGTIANGIDLSGYTITTAAFKSGGFYVDGVGRAALGNTGGAAVVLPASEATYGLLALGSEQIIQGDTVPGATSSFQLSQNAVLNSGVFRFVSTGPLPASNYQQAAGAHAFRVSSTSGVAGATITWLTSLSIPNAAPASGNAGVLVLVNDGAVTSLRQVSIGATDSGGTGFRLLRVAN